MDYDALIEEARQAAITLRTGATVSYEQIDTLAHAYLFVLGKLRHMEDESDLLWHKLHPESMGR